MSSLIFPGWLLGKLFTQRKVPKWSTGKQRALTGKISRIARQIYPLYDWELAFEVLSDGHPLMPSRINYVPNSQDFTQWTTFFGGTNGIAPVIVGSWFGTTAPDGTYTADRVILNQGVAATGNFSQIAAPLNSPQLVGTTYTFSIWMRTNDGSTVQVSVTVHPEAATPPAVNVNVTPVWQRFVYTYTVTTASTPPNFAIVTISGSTFPVFVDLSCWGAQVENGPIATFYRPTFGAAQRTLDLRTLLAFFAQLSGAYDTFLYSDPDLNTATHQQFATGNGAQTAFNLTVQPQPGIEGDQLTQLLGGMGIPEWVQNTNGAAAIYTMRYGAPELLGSSSRTNILTQSNFVSGWTTTNLTLTTGVAGAPDGSSTVAQLVDTTTNAAHDLAHGLTTITGGARYTYSCFAKYSSQQYVALVMDDGSSNGLSVTFDLVNVAFQGNANGTAYWSQADVSITPFANGWFRLSISCALATTVTSMRNSVVFMPSAAAGWYPSYAGTGTNTLLIWGAQLEAGTQVTALIPTTSSSASSMDYSLTNLSVSGPVQTFQQVSFTSAPANTVPLIWSGSFFYRCRFSEDQVEFEEFMYRLWELKTLKLEQVLL